MSIPFDFGDLVSAYREWVAEKADDGKVSPAEYMEILGHLCLHIADDLPPVAQPTAEAAGQLLVEIARLLGEEIEED